MKKKIISIILIGIMVCSVCACGSTESVELREEYSESETIQEKEIPEKAEAIYIIQPKQDDTYEMQEWQKAYADYLEGLDQNPNNTYSLIYVDEDDIPELVIDRGIEADGCQILTFYNGEIDVLRTIRLHFYYIEKKNLLDNCGGNSGLYFNYIYSIENGKWIYVTGGEWTERMGDDDLVYRYEWDGEEVEEDEYVQRLNMVFDGPGIKPDMYYYFDEMLSLLKTGDVSSQKHCYELYIEDVTCDEARSRCEDRGGYLATCTTLEEFERIQKGIVDSGQTDILFWVDDKLLDQVEEKVDSRSVEGKYEGNYLLYDDIEEKCLLYFAPSDILLLYPEDTGKIGYICEYDTPKVQEHELN